MQSFSWRDLTLRRLRDGSRVREAGFTCHYEITPVGLEAPGHAPVPGGAGGALHRCVTQDWGAAAGRHGGWGPALG